MTIKEQSMSRYLKPKTNQWCTMYKYIMLTNMICGWKHDDHFCVDYWVFDVVYKSMTKIIFASWHTITKKTVIKRSTCTDLFYGQSTCTSDTIWKTSSIYCNGDLHSIPVLQKKLIDSSFDSWNVTRIFLRRQRFFEHH